MHVRPVFIKLDSLCQICQQCRIHQLPHYKVLKHVYNAVFEIGLRYIYFETGASVVLIIACCQENSQHDVV